MARDDESPAEPDRHDVMDLGMVSGARDVIDLGPSGATPTRTVARRWPRWWPALPALALVIGYVAVHNSGAESGATTTHRPQDATVSRSAGGDEVPAGDQTPQPVVTQYFDHPFLGGYAEWELYGLGPTNVIRIEFAKTRLTRTEFPALASSGPVSFVVGTDAAIIRPLDHVPGYRIPDGEPAAPLTRLLAGDGPALPGPVANDFWVPASSGHDRMMLVNDGGDKLGPTIDIPYPMNALPEPDGTGYLILTDETGAYDARPGGLLRITTGVLVAVGPTRWLVSECDKHHHCARIAIDRDTGHRHVVDHVAPEPTPITGAISPDGRYAALVEFDDQTRYGLHLLDLHSGRDHKVSAPMDDSMSGTPLAWSPDSRWVFAAGAAGELFPVRAATGTVQLLSIPVPPLDQLVIRNGNS